MKSTLILAVAVALLSLAFTAPLAHASSTQVPRRGGATQLGVHRRAAQPAVPHQASQPASAFDPTPFREGIPPPPAVTVAHRNYRRGSPEWDVKAAGQVRLKRAKHAVKVLQARIHAASHVPLGQRENELFEGRLRGSENEDHGEDNDGGHFHLPKRISDEHWAREELRAFSRRSEELHWEGTGDSAKAQTYARLFDSISQATGALSVGRKLHPGWQGAGFRAVYADEFILWFGAWLPPVDVVTAWLAQARSNPDARHAPVDALAALVPTFFRPFDALCASSTVSAELLVVVRIRLLLIKGNLFLWAGGVNIPALKSEPAVDGALAILSQHFSRADDAPTLVATQAKLCGGDSAPLRKVLSYHP